MWRSGKTCLTALVLCAGLSPAGAAAGDNDAALAGKQIYHAYCVICHGPNMNNPGNRTFDLRKFPLSQKSRFMTVVRKGKKEMPAWGDVFTPDELDKLWAYIQTRGQI